MQADGAGARVGCRVLRPVLPDSQVASIRPAATATAPPSSRWPASDIPQCPARQPLGLAAWASCFSKSFFSHSLTTT